MPKQPAIPGLSDAMKTKVTRREQFLAEMDAVVPWARLIGLIAPHYPKAGPKGGRPPMPLETMLRVYFLQNWYALSDPMAEETLYDSEAMRRFAGIELGDDRIPDETTILNFRHLLERHGLTEALFTEVNAHLADKGISLRSGIDVFARRIVGWRASRTANAGFVLDALEQAIHQRTPAQHKLVHHSDRGSQYLSIKYTERLAEAKIAPSVGSVEDSYDNALAETINGLFKAEVFHRRGQWRNVEAVEYAALESVDWFNNRCLLDPIGNIPPAEAEANFYAALERKGIAA